MASMRVAKVCWRGERGQRDRQRAQVFVVHGKYVGRSRLSDFQFILDELGSKCRNDVFRINELFEANAKQVVVEQKEFITAK